MSGGDAVLHRIEALAGSGRYAVTFRRADGSEQTAVVHVPDGSTAGVVDVAEASLPTGWTRDAEPFTSTAAAVAAVHLARSLAPTGATLRDVEGGWDVSLGNVVLDPSGTPTCIADGELALDRGVWTCPVCGAAALLG